MKGTWDEAPDPLSALRAGDSSRFEAFVESEAGTLVAFFTRLGAGRAEAEDLCQEVFLKMYRSVDSYRSQDRFVPFVFRIARNAWIDRRRRRAIRPVGEDEDGGTPLARMEDDSEPALEHLSRREEVARLHSALADLSEPHRLVFELGVLQEMPYADISETLDIPVGTVKSRMFHAVRKLREALEAKQ